MTAAANLAQRADELVRRRTPFVRATVVRAAKPTSSKAGDTALVLADGSMEGFVGGSCAESTVRDVALDLLATGESLLLRITPDPPDEEPPPAPPGERVVHNPCLSGGTLEIFLQPQVPPPVLAVLGDAPIARALRDLGARAGFAVVDVGASAGAGVPPDTIAVVVASHGQGEEPVLEAAVQAGVPYVGLVASRRRGAAVVRGLNLDGAQKSAIHTPAGLDIDARTPEEVAISILAELIATGPRIASSAP